MIAMKIDPRMACGYKGRTQNATGMLAAAGAAVLGGAAGLAASLGLVALLGAQRAVPPDGGSRVRPAKKERHLEDGTSGRAPAIRYASSSFSSTTDTI